MSFVDQKRGPSASGLAGAIIVQATIGAVMLAGLSITHTIIQQEETPPIIEFPIEPPPPAPPPPEPAETTPEVAAIPPLHVPTPKFELDIMKPRIDTTDLILPPQPPMPPAPRPDLARPVPSPSFAPVDAKPRNDPGRWLTDRDYRASWARRELTGTAGFRLDIAVDGRVTGCRIVKSTGHGQLDEATCDLLPQRAKFEPARGTNGEPVAGQYSGTVLWKLPE